MYLIQSAATMGCTPGAVAYAPSSSVYAWQGAFTYQLDVMTDYQVCFWCCPLMV
jgi:hypothetical protein